MMGKGQKIVTTVLWAAAVIGMLGLVGTGLWARKYSAPRPAIEEQAVQAAATRYFPAPPFSLIDQNAQQVSDQSLHGHVWIADFIFTNCAGPCPKMSALMADFQEKITHPQVKLVSFTVDPLRDTPEVLKAYGQQFGADETRWIFLTGTEQQMQQVASGMKMAAEKGQDNQITHSTYFILVDQQGQVRGLYGLNDPTTPDRLTTDAVKLAGEPAEARP
jgi:protein SCO1/2